MIVRVRSTRPDRLFVLLQRYGFTVARVDAHQLEVAGSTAEELERFAHFFHVPLQHLCAATEGRR